MLFYFQIVYQMDIVVMKFWRTFAVFIFQYFFDRSRVEDHAAAAGLIVVAAVLVVLVQEVELEQMILDFFF